MYSVPTGTQGVAGQIISPTAYNIFLADLSTAITESLWVDQYDPDGIVEQVIGETATQTMSNKTLVAPNINIINLTGGQIAFPAVANPSADPNTLDDYEEGTVANPTVTFGGASVGLTYGSRLIVYTKIGNRVSGNVNIALSDNGSSTGAMAITGLPFTPASASGGAVGVCAAFTGLTGSLVFAVAASSTTIGVRQSAAAGNAATVTDAETTNTTNFNFGFSFST